MGIGGCARDRVTGDCEVFDQRHHACGHVETDRIAGASGRAGIIRHQHGDAALRALCCAQADKRRDPVRDHLDPVGFGPARKRGEGKPLLRRQRILESDGACEDAAIKLGQDDVHGKIGSAKSARAVAPCGALRRGADNLQHRHVAGVERRRLAAMAARRERGRGDDHGGPKPREGVVKECSGLGILQAGDDERRRRQTARRQRRAQRVNRCGIGCKQQCAIENDRHDRLARFERGGKPIEIDRTFARQIAGETRHRLGLARRKLEGGMACEPAQHCPQVLAAALAEIAQQYVEFRRRQCRSGGEAGVVAILARQHGKHDVRVRAPAPTGARSRISTNRDRRAAAPQSPWRGRRRDRSIDRPTSGAADRADARAGRSAGRNAPRPTPRQGRSDRCRRTTVSRYRRATGRDRPLRQSRRGWLRSPRAGAFLSPVTTQQARA